VLAARVSQFNPDTVRIVMDLARPMALSAASQKPDRTLVLTLRPIDPDAFARTVRGGRVPVPGLWASNPVPPGPVPAPFLKAESDRRLADIEAAIAAAERQVAAGSPAVPPPLAGASPLAPAPSPAFRPRGDRPLVVVLDAGHGGKDPGAPAVTGGQEKEVTLAIALAAKRAIERRARASGQRIEVRLTRDDDRFVTLGNRVRLARQWRAQLFLSIHADSAPNPDARGATVYTLSDTASDREAARMAARENRADIIAGIDLGQEDREVAGLLIDLGMRESMNASADFAQMLQRRMAAEDVPFRTSFHRFAGFQVLRNLGVPAVLLETGYLSNAADSQRLLQRAGQQAIAEGIARAVVEWAGGA
jgi:N-acetylmuramoyl-L-alanine amidase